MSIQPGDRYTKGGVAIDVHAVKDGEVLFRKWNIGVQRQRLFENCYRISIAKFEWAVRGAVKEANK